MAYGTKYTINCPQAINGNNWRVYIKEREYSGSSTELDPGSTPIAIQYTPTGFYGGTPHWNMCPSTASIEFIDDTTGKLAEVLDADDEKYQILIEEQGINRDEWTGFVISDSYSYNLYSNGISRLRATDRLQDLQKIPFATSAGVLYSGRATLIEIAARCLDATSLDLGMSTHLRWYPHIGTNDLASTADPFVNIRINQEVFRDGDDNPFSKWAVLEQICLRFQLQLYQIQNRWLFIQRKRSEEANEQYDVWNYDKDGNSDSPATSQYTIRKETSVDENSDSFLVGPSISGTIPYGQVKVTYFHGNPFKGLFSDLSFEAPADALRDPVGGTPLINEAAGYAAGITSIAVDGLTPSVNIQEGAYFTIDSDSTSTLHVLTTDATVDGGGNTTLAISPGLAEAVANNDALTFHEYLGGWAEDASSGHNISSTDGENLNEDDNSALELDVEFNTAAAYSRKVRQRSIEQFTGGAGFRLKTGWSIKVKNIQNTATEVYHAFRMYVEGTSTWYYKWSDNTWTTTATTNEVPLSLGGSGWSDNIYDQLTIITAELDDGGTAITGYLWIEFYEGREHDDTTNAQTVTEIYVDNVVQPVILQSDLTPADEAIQVLMTYTGNVNRAEPDVPTLVTGDGPTSGHKSRLTVYDSAGAEQSTTSDWSYLPAAGVSGYSLDQFWANQMIMEFSRSNKQIRAGVFSTATGISDGLRPYHNLQIENPDTTTQSDYTWKDLTYTPTGKVVLTGTFVQLQERTAADKICTVNVKPNTALLAGIPTEEGLVCETLSDFTGTQGATHIYLVEESAPPVVYKAAISESVPWTATSIFTMASGRTHIHMRVDQSAGYIFTLENTGSGNKLMRRNLDGTNATELIDDTNTFLVNFTIHRGSQYIYTSWLASPNYEIKRYDYDGTVVDTLVSAAGTKAQALCVDDTETNMYYRLSKTGDDPIIKHVISSGSESDLIANATYSVSGETMTLRVDNTYDHLFVFSDLEDKIDDIDLTTPAENSLVTGLSAGVGFAIDRLRQKMYGPSASTGDVDRWDYDGTNNETAVDLGAGANAIGGIDLGVD